MISGAPSAQLKTPSLEDSLELYGNDGKSEKKTDFSVKKWLKITIFDPKTHENEEIAGNYGFGVEKDRK